MAEPVRLMAISGSLRAGSTNTAMLRLAASRLPAGAVLDFADLMPIPLYNQDVEDLGMPPAVTALREQARASAGLMIATPEYNFSIPGVLKNALDWLSRPLADPVLAGKPVAILGAGGRLGTARAQRHLREICHGLDMRPLSRPELFLVRSWEQFDASGQLRDAGALATLDEMVTTLLAATR